MAICILLVILWVLYSFAMVILLGYLADLPPTPIFDMRDIGLCFVCLLALAGWIGLTFFAGTYILGG